MGQSANTPPPDFRAGLDPRQTCVGAYSRPTSALIALRGWIREHNRCVKASGRGLRLLVCPLPIKSPWLNPIEPTWAHTKRQVVEPDRLLPARELAERVCEALDCPYHAHIPIPEKAA